jgi:hypothetical protein
MPTNRGLNIAYIIIICRRKPPIYYKFVIHIHIYKEIKFGAE